MLRSVDECPFRLDARRVSGGGEVALCELVARITGTWSFVSCTPRQTCEYCCQQPKPHEHAMNAVIATMVYDAASRVIDAGGVDPCNTFHAWQLQRRAVRELEVVPRPSHDAKGLNDEPMVSMPAALVDASITVSTLTDHLGRNEPFTYARYCDGEWLSMLGDQGMNCDGHAYLPHRLGRELRQSLDELATRVTAAPSVYVGLLREWLQGDIQYYLRVAELADKIHWVGGNLLYDGLRDLSTKRFLDAVRQYAGRKYLVANRRLRCVARALGCTHVVVPERNCYLRIDRAERACRFRGPGLVLLCAGMAAECLIRRLRRRNQAASYVDCGHIFDAMVDRPTRQYTQQNEDGIIDFLKVHYAPILLGGRPGRGQRVAHWLGRARESLRIRARSGKDP